MKPVPIRDYPNRLFFLQKRYKLEVQGEAESLEI